MKILHVLDHSLPLHSGYTFRSQSIFRAQRARGWQPVVVTAPKHEQSWQGAWSALEEIDGVRYYRTGAVAPCPVPLLTEWRLMQATTRRLLEVAASERPDLLHAHSPVLNAYPALRAGRHEEAQEKLTALGERMDDPNSKSNASPAYTWYFLAMTDHQLGHHDQAANWLQKANAWTDKVLADAKNPPRWNRKATLELLRKEAESLIGSGENSRTDDQSAIAPTPGQ